MKNLSIRTRIVLGFALPLAMVFLFVLWLNWQLNQVQHSVRQVVDTTLESTLRSQDMDKNVVQIQQFLSDISATRGLDGLDDGFKNAELNFQELNKRVDAFEAQYKAEGNELQLRNMQNLREQARRYYSSGTAMAQAYVKSGPEAGNKLMGDFDKASEALQKTLQPFVEQQSNAMRQDLGGAADTATRVARAALAVLAAVIVLGLWVTLRIASDISAPILQAVTVARAVADGDLGCDVPTTDSVREVGQLMLALQDMRDKLERVVGSVVGIATQLAHTSGEIAHGNGDLSSRTEQQAATLEQTAASMQELGDNVTHNAAGAQLANQLAQSASAVATRGGHAVGQVVQTMGDINQSSQKIADIISVIDGIAFQTNILALNAAVEAARAGEQGRGFAVVASEVRALAGRSAGAAKEIKTLIDASVQRVAQGSSLVNEAGQTMTQLVDEIRRVTDIMGEISTASKDQAHAVAQVGSAVHQMDQATQHNAALVEQMATAAGGLSSQAQDLLQAVQVFKLRAGAPVRYMALNR